MIRTAIDAFGGLDVVVNNAGILRDRMLVNMTPEEWDAVIRVHLRGTFATEPARRRLLAGARPRPARTNDARIINTTSPSGIYGNVGQTNYGAAKAGIAAFTVIAVHGGRPLRRDRQRHRPVRPDPDDREPRHGPDRRPSPAADAVRRPAPSNIAPLVVWLGSPESRGITGRVFNVGGGHISVAEGWVEGPAPTRSGRWDPAELGEIIPDLVARAAPERRHGGAGPDGASLPPCAALSRRPSGGPGGPARSRRRSA